MGSEHVLVVNHDAATISVCGSGGVTQKGGMIFLVVLL